MALFDVCGIRMADVETACRIFYFPTHHALKEAAKDGFPAVKIFDRYFYPVDLGRKYFTVKDRKTLRPAVDELTRKVHRYEKDDPKDKWFRKVDDFNDAYPWQA